MSSSAQYFAEVAQEWDEIRSGFFTEEMRDAAIEKAGLGETAVDIDCAAGTCDCSAPDGNDIALSIFVAIGQKA